MEREKKSWYFRNLWASHLFVPVRLRPPGARIRVTSILVSELENIGSAKVFKKGFFYRTKVLSCIDTIVGNILTLVVEAWGKTWWTIVKSLPLLVPNWHACSVCSHGGTTGEMFHFPPQPHDRGGGGDMGYTCPTFWEGGQHTSCTQRNFAHNKKYFS